MNSLIREIYELSPQKIYRYFAKRRRNTKAKAYIERYIAKHTHKKLHIGCGGNYLEEWLNTDLIPDHKEIVSLDAGKIFPIRTHSFDYIYSEHLIEHLDFAQQLNFISESYRILKPGGKIRIATPDFDFLSKLSVNKNNKFETDYLKWNFQTFLKYIPSHFVDAAHLDVYVINNYFRDWGHQLIHNKASLAKLLTHTGFSEITFETVGQSSDPAMRGLEQHGKMITDEYNNYETMVIEASKT